MTIWDHLALLFLFFSQSYVLWRLERLGVLTIMLCQQLVANYDLRKELLARKLRDYQKARAGEDLKRD